MYSWLMDYEARSDSYGYVEQFLDHRLSWINSYLNVLLFFFFGTIFKTFKSWGIHYQLWLIKQ